MIKIAYKEWAYNPDKRDLEIKNASRAFKDMQDFLDFIMNQDYESIELTVCKSEILYTICPTYSIAIRKSPLIKNDIAYLSLFPDPRFERVHQWDIEKIWLNDVLIADLKFGQGDSYVSEEFMKKVVIPLYDYFPSDLITDEVGLLNKNSD